jgi:hypothetical protein
MVLVVSEFCGLRFSSHCFTPHASPLTSYLDLFHPFYLTDFFKLNVERHPGASHLRVHLTQSPFSNASAGAVAHELRALGFERTIRNWRALMDSAGVLSAFVFPKDDYAC